MRKVVFVRAPTFEKDRDDFLNRVDLDDVAKKGGADSVRLGFQKAVLVECGRDKRSLAYIVYPPAVVGQE